jgi:hypothetical protein
MEQTLAVSSLFSASICLAAPMEAARPLPVYGTVIFMDNDLAKPVLTRHTCGCMVCCSSLITITVDQSPTHEQRPNNAYNDLIG